MNVPTYPVRVDAHLDPQLSRGLWLVKWLLAIPHYIVLAFLWLAFWVMSVIAFFAILFTGRYPRSIFEFNVGVLRWSWRVTYYSYGALGTDRYPPFSLQERPDYPAHLDVDHPEHLSRGLVLVKWWLLAIPHYLVVGILVSGGWFAYDTATGDYKSWGMGLIGLLVLIAAVTLLFTGRYPQTLFDLVMGLNRWVLRVAGYASLMTDEYPPFRLDQGGPDPGTLALAAAPAGAGVPAAPVGAVPAGAAQGTTGHWTAGRVVSLVAGCLLLLGALGAGLAGGTLAVANATMRDDAGFLMSPQDSFSTGTYALTSANLEVHTDVPSSEVPQRLLGDAKLRVTAVQDQPVFVGIARTSDVDAFLGDTLHATVVDFGRRPVYRTNGSTAPATLPGDSDIWVAQSEGTGTQEITWPVERGDWTLVVMNADGSRGVNVDVAAGAEVPALVWVVVGLLVGAAIGLLLAVLFIGLALLPRRTS
ncbi:MAG TPA: DUF4389 domain-containing protein [Nocardioides sp.]|uniref:DUF4389 domain-containing protein n=1 Tax=Nocardioides sp. TaxID=35761 RepID=UPI002CF5CB91|nr:DUF4389 domain-containing protein [Nocardioides sp.]HQR28030.1 DUF4389 domain-containing protein [Nocardioides sp.]